MGKTEVLGEKLLTVTVCPPQFSNGLIRDRDKTELYISSSYRAVNTMSRL